MYIAVGLLTKFSLVEGAIIKNRVVWQLWDGDAKVSCVDQVIDGAIKLQRCSAGAFRQTFDSPTNHIERKLIPTREFIVMEQVAAYSEESQQ